MIIAAFGRSCAEETMAVVCEGQRNFLEVKEEEAISP